MSSSITVIEPRNLDLVMRDSDFVIWYGEGPLTTPGGNEVSHPDSRLLKHLMIKLTLAPYIDCGCIGSFSIFSFCRDVIEAGTDPFGDRLNELISSDPVLKTRFEPGAGNRLFGLGQGDSGNDHQLLHLVFLGASVILKGFRDYLSGMEGYPAIEKDLPGHRAEVTTFLQEAYNGLPAQKRAVINLLNNHHDNGILLPLLLVSSKISPSEYALATMAIQEDFAGHESMSTCHEQALKAMEYLDFFEGSGKKMSVIAELIAQGENDKVEFKSTFRWDIRQEKKNPAIEHAALKSMTAFLNSDGGDLLIGVADDGSVVGIETDNFPNDDKFLLHVWNLIKTSIGQDISPYIVTTLEKMGGKTVCRVHCKRSPKPVFLRQSGFDEMFYIRVGPSSGSLEISEALKYIGQRF